MRFSGDGRHASNRCDFTLFTVTLLFDTNRHKAPSPHSSLFCVTFALVQAPEGDDRTNGDVVYKQVMKMIRSVLEDGIRIEGDFEADSWTQYFTGVFCSDWKFLCTLMGKLFLF